MEKQNNSKDITVQCKNSLVKKFVGNMFTYHLLKPAFFN